MNDWDFEIKPKTTWLNVDLKELWNYRDLFVMYVKREIVTVYKQTILGPLWFFIQPVFTTIMYMFVFGGLAGISTEGIPQGVFYLSGILLWNYFNSCFTSSSTVFTANAAVFGKVYFPRLVVPLAGITSNLLKLGIQLLLFIGVYSYYLFKGEVLSPNLYILLFPFIILILALTAFSWGLIISALTTKYRDLMQLVTFAMQLFMYATPIIYPLSAAPEKYRRLLEINPLSPLFETFRFSVTGVGEISWSSLVYSCVWMLITLFFAILLFNRVERDFMDTV